MSCSTKPGVSWAINIIHDVFGVTITSGTWHQLRSAAFSVPGQIPSRTRCDAHEIVSSVNRLARAGDGKYSDGSSIDKYDLRAEALSVAGITTRSTVQVLHFITKFDVKEVVDLAHKVSKTAQAKCSGCSTPRPGVAWSYMGTELSASCKHCGKNFGNCHINSATGETQPVDAAGNPEGEDFLVTTNGGVACRSCGNTDGTWFFPARDGGFPTFTLDPKWDKRTFVCGKCHTLNKAPLAA